MAAEYHSHTARRRLADRFEDQSRFASGYAPAAARVFAVVGDWLAGADASDAGEWLVNEAAGLQPFAVTHMEPTQLSIPTFPAAPGLIRLASQILARTARSMWLAFKA
jgi:hypothetical protein